MDQRRFDQWTRLFAATTPRRAVARLLTGSAIGTALTALGLPEAAGKGDDDDDDDCRRPGKACKRDDECCSRQCAKRPGKKVGKCRLCPAGTTGCPARRACIPAGECCTAADCGACERCQPDGTCVNGCAPDQTCQDGKCVSDCTPDCAGKVCGGDGCDGSCGTCLGANDECRDGQCVCLPDCAGRDCGDDGCGGSCGACAGNEACEDGRCRCVPKCAGKVCGNDGCGESCGSCPGANEICQDGACVCVPDCAGKACGGDGCGGSCGACPGNQTCQGGGCACPNDLPKECDGVCFPAGSCCPGASRACYTGPNGTEGVGICRAGTETCRDDGTFGPCGGEVTPQAETCNDQDDDCDGTVDNGNLCPHNQECLSGQCVCPAGTEDCNGDGTCEQLGTDAHCAGCNDQCAGGKTCRDGACACPANLPVECDGVCFPAGSCCPGTTRACYTGPAGTENVGICVAGTETCRADGTFGPCDDEVTPRAETCNGLDDDCDGAVDNGNLCPAGRVCRDGACRCPVGQTECGGGCIDTDNDRTNCGACGNVCPANRACRHGVCTSHVFAAAFGSEGDGDGQFRQPIGIARDAGGAAFVTDRVQNRVQAFAIAVVGRPFGAFLDKWGTSGSGNREFAGPTGIAHGGNNILFVADTGNHRIQRFAGSSFVAAFGTQGSGPGQFVSPEDVTAEILGDFFYVADTGNHRIQKIRLNGQHIWTVGGPAAGSGNGQFDAPGGVALDGRNGHLYVADTGNNRIQKIDLNGVWLATFGGPGSGNGQLNRPQGMAVGGGGGPVADENRLYVVDSGNDRVQVFRRDGSFYTKWGRRGGGGGEFRSPDGIVIDGGEGVFVVDSGNRRVQKFSPAPA